MLISTNWIKDFVDLDGIDLKALIEQFTLSTAEVEEIIERGAEIKNVVSAKIMSVENHPDSKKLHILEVFDGTETFGIVCGAPNVRPDMTVALVREGGFVAGMEIKTAKIAGVESHGMCCSERELGISEEHAGILELPDGTPLGRPIDEIIPIKDIIFEVDNKSLTNRPDLWGHYGIAREIAALIGRPLKAIPLASTDEYASLTPVRVRVENGDKCLRYTSIKIANVTKKVSSIDMRIRLFYCGMRAINLLTDLTNYTMLELGQPMHAFDNALVDDINVRTFPEDIEFTTLDNEQRGIPVGSLMICNGNEPVAIAGIMGGLKSSIQDDTNSVLLESANFDGVMVRKTATALGHRTDSSARYEKILDPELTETAAKRFLLLLSQIDSGIKVISSLTDVYLKHYPVINLNITKAFIDKYTGINIDNARIVKTLSALGFGITERDNSFDVTVPSFRATKDVSLKADLIEEITRIYGYDNFDIKTTKVPLTPVRQSAAHEDEYTVKLMLAQQFGMSEVHSYIWYNQKLNKELGLSTGANVEIVNSVSPELCTLREYMAPSLLYAAAANKNAAGNIGLFEIGKVIKGLRPDGSCFEKKTLGLLFAGKNSSEQQVFYKVKSAVESICHSIKHLTPELDTAPQLQCWMHDYTTASVRLVGKDIGYISLLHPAVKNNLDKKLSVCIAELDLEVFDSIPAGNPLIKEISRFPGMDFDLTLITGSDVTYADINKYLSGYMSDVFNGFTLADVYFDKNKPDIKSVTLRFYFSSMEKTLSMPEIDTEKEKIVTILRENGVKINI